MTVRALTPSGDWTFGSGLNNYLSGTAEVAQNIQTRLSMWLGDCSFSLYGWIDWQNLLGSKNEVALNLAISTIIVNTDNVTGILQLSSNLNHATRNYAVSYSVQTTYSTVITDSFVYSLNGTGTL